MGENLRMKRGQIKAKLTRLRAYFESIGKQNLENNVVAQLQFRLESNIPLLDQFEEVQTELEIQQPSDTDSIEREQFENLYFQVIGDIKSLCTQFSVTNDVRSQQSEGGEINSIRSNRGNYVQGVKLPKISLPSFDGSYDNWVEFRDSFQALVNRNEVLSEIQKFYYLKSSLQRDAAQLIKSIEVSESNYKLAWQMLVDRFENKKLIIHNHIKAIFELPILNRESYVDLRNLFDNFTKNLRALNNLGEHTEYWDSLLLYILTDKFDSRTRRDWESYKYEGELPKINDINLFLKERCCILEKLERNKHPITNKRQTNSFIAINKGTCYFCSKDHLLYTCESFLKLPINERITEARKLRLCLNCFRKNHSSWDCKAQKCRKCNKPHNSILHLNYNSNNNKRDIKVITNSEVSGGPTEATVEETQISAHSVQTNSFTQALLCTALIKIKDINNKFQIARVLLDSGSQSNFITENMVKKLGIRSKPVNYSVKGVGKALEHIKNQVRINFESCVNNYNIDLNCLVINQITETLPLISFDKNKISMPQNLQLADPSFNVSSDIDILLGSSIFWSLICVGQIKLGNSRLILQETKLGWVVSGDLKVENCGDNVACFNVLTNLSIENLILKFWETEEINANQHSLLSASEKFCETNFQKTTKRDQDGRFIVTIPFNDSIEKLGKSYDLAAKRFRHLESKLENNKELKLQYSEFIKEYIQLGHMTSLGTHKEVNALEYFMPHHAVFKDSSSTTKLRVVFDASARTTTGISLNQAQHVGPTIQRDLFAIILGFRKHRFVITADVSKMYRQIWVSPKQRRFQKILWRFQTDAEIECFQLNTVTYGTASAPYLAVRCLYQLALDYEATFPTASKAIKNCFYMDDLLTGADTLEGILKLQGEISDILATGGFELRKWLSNEEEIMSHLRKTDKLSSTVLYLGNSESKTLGIQWESDLDNIQYEITLDKSLVTTKRSILSTLCKIFDPLGLLSPVIIVGKIVIQKLWQENLGWDDKVPGELVEKWKVYKGELNELNKLRIPRQAIDLQGNSVELHGFCDASEQAFGACIYVKNTDSMGKVTTRLLCAKSRVAPLKKLTLPRLELNSALLLAQLMRKTLDVLEIKSIQEFYWSDSEVALAWLRGPPNKWKTFVGNRVAEIQTLSNSQRWYHVKSEDNPADLVSRGMNPSDFIRSNFWWEGPIWLKQKQSPCNSYVEPIRDVNLEQRIVAHPVTTFHKLELFSRISTYNKLIRTMAYVVRFCKNIKSVKSLRIFGPLTTLELNKALNKLLIFTQLEGFPKEYENLVQGKLISNKSSIISLNPFMKEGLIRVGGRIKNSSYQFEKKHPILLPYGHKLTELILKQKHLDMFHCGAQCLLYTVREEFWPLAGRKLARSIVRKCVRCFKVNPKNYDYLMGDLPEVRIKPSSPFLNVGIDYGGPFLLKDRKTRGAKLFKAYLCLFVCMSTKAVHLEIVTDLSTNSFLATLKRFIARRGKPINIYSDNALNFVGAKNEITELYKFIEAESNDIAEKLSCQQVNWHFIPARAANFGGLWEAGIKSCKAHIKRVMGNANLTFEDFTTVLIKIESILNSRPIAPMSSDPNDPMALTPGHFLIGRALTSLPEANLKSISENRLDHYQRLQSMYQHFWVRWQKEYVSELQMRTKWKKHAAKLIQMGSLVIIKEDDVPVLNWKLGRVVELHPGKDGITRVISVRVNKSVIKRALTKVCVLPIDL